MAPQKAAPKTTVVAKTFLTNSDTSTALIQVAYEVRADVADSADVASGANTKLESEGGITDSAGVPVTDANGKPVAFQLPGYAWQSQKGKKVVTELKGKFQMIFTLVIQTHDASGVTAEQNSGYGRGTTTEDEAAGDTSLGFHESCHRADYLEYLRTDPLPTYKGKTGITEQEFRSSPRVRGRNRAFHPPAADCSALFCDQAGRPSHGGRFDVSRGQVNACVRASEP